MLTKRDRRVGFTLIELLIVVAIIAVLAAIAVPNYLSAQIRAKVTASIADMRNLGTAVEAYMADYGVYPPTQNTVQTLGSPQPSSGIYSGYRLLTCTTPVPYISQLYNDAFSQDPNGPGPTPRDALPYNWRNVTEVIRGGVVVTDPSLSGGQQDYWWIKIRKRPIYVFWGYGPDKDFRYGFYDPTYDPTNGIISDGDIYMTGPGNEFPALPPGP